MPVFKVFEGLSKSETSRIFDLGMICPIEDGTVLFRKGDIGHEMYVVLTGRIGIVDTSEAGTDEIAELGPGELFGEMAMFEKSFERSASAIARESGQVLVLSEETLHKFIESVYSAIVFGLPIACICAQNMAIKWPLKWND